MASHMCCSSGAILVTVGYLTKCQQAVNTKQEMVELCGSIQNKQ